MHFATKCNVTHELLVDWLVDTAKPPGQSMASSRALNQLTVRQIMSASIGDLSDGGGLTLRLLPGSRNWILRFTAPSGRRREMGLGTAEITNSAATGASLRRARDLAAAARAKLAMGIDPIDERAETRERVRREDRERREVAKRDRLTLARACRDYHERFIETRRSTKHARQWIASLENHVPQALWHAPLEQIDAPTLLDLILELYSRAPETAMRIRQRLEAVFEDCIFRGRCATNPAAAIKRKLREAHTKRARGSFAALPYREMPQFLCDLRRQEGIAARCLEFAILTAARTTEALHAEWSEIDWEGGIWTVPASRMKGGDEHRVHLSESARKLLESLRGVHERLIFPSSTGRALSNMAMLVLLKRMGMNTRTTVHGLCRTTFSTWANETDVSRPDVIEACLAHRETDRIRAAYNRAQFITDRRQLMEAWAAFLVPSPTKRNAVVIPMVRTSAQT